MGKHSGKSEDVDLNDTQSIRIREQIPIDMSDGRVAEDVKIIDEGYNSVYDRGGNKRAN